MKTDTQLRDDIVAELDWEPSVIATHIGVEVSSGIVTLTGHVSSWAVKYHAELAARRVAGVKALAIEMDIKLAGIGQRTDAEIAAAAKNAVQWTTFAANDAIHVEVEKGFVTLTGELEWEYQREAAALAVRYLLRVTGLNDRLTLKQIATSQGVKTDIEAALKRRAHSDAQAVGVKVKGNGVTLTGTVHGFDERDTARQAALSSPGVYNLVDRHAIID